MRILFIGPTRIGDAVLSSGLLQYLTRNYPDARITVACGVPAAPLFENVPGLERLIAMEKRPHSGHWWALWRAVAPRRWALVVDLRRSIVPWTVMTARRAIAPPPAQCREHAVISFARTLGLSENPPFPHLWTTPAHDAAAASLIPASEPVLGIGPTANWRGKTWRGESFVETIERLTGEGPEAIMPGARIAVFGGPGEREEAGVVLASIPEARRIDLVDRVDLPTVAACLSRCALYIGNDSGLMHMAAAAGVATLGLFGPSRPEVYGPWGARNAWVRTEIPFEDLIGAPGYDHRTTDTLMDSLRVDTVVAAAADLWRRASGEPVPA